ncbi:hypothetical protein [Arthrobacter alpinus]|uniref:hypothetical protein n=1 Tax=Arthrobacter alpinus TaxID=656366 RepID=UPI00101AE62E|nr:hypothetical protein [Arthrobacter alpinus]
MSPRSVVVSQAERLAGYSSPFEIIWCHGKNVAGIQVSTANDRLDSCPIANELAQEKLAMPKSRLSIIVAIAIRRGAGRRSLLAQIFQIQSVGSLRIQ